MREAGGRRQRERGTRHRARRPCPCDTRQAALACSLLLARAPPSTWESAQACCGLLTWGLSS